MTSAMAEIVSLQRQLEEAKKLAARYKDERDEARSIARLARDPNLDAAELAVHVDGAIAEWD